MKCPIYSEELIADEENPNGAPLSIAQFLDTCTEYYDVDVLSFRCSNSHIIYIDVENLK